MQGIKPLHQLLEINTGLNVVEYNRLNMSQTFLEKFELSSEKVTAQWE